MCGILGSINIPIPMECLDEMRHRGPDDFGIEVEEVSDRRIYLGQRRLSILDLSDAGHQPMLIDDRKYALIFNGEIYNHEDLRSRLPADIEYRGHSDSETLIHYLRHYGIEGVRDLNGIFSFAFLDKGKSKLYLARDPFGVKPLYFSHNEFNSLIFSSELRAIRRAVGQQEIDKPALATLLRLRYNPAPNTLWEGINKIRPGHYREFDLSQGDLSPRDCYYTFKSQKAATGSKDELTRLYAKKIDAAVKRQLLADVEIGVMLSGGIDSAVVATLAQKYNDRPLKAFTIGFEGDYAEDEVEEAAETADILGLEHHYRRISFSDFLGQIEHCTKIVEEPLATTSMIPMYYLSDLASQHVKVVLTGQGADEPLGGYSRYKGEILHNMVPTYLHSFMPGILNMPRNNDKLRRGAKLFSIKDEPKRFLAAYEVFTESEIDALIGHEGDRALAQIKYHYDALQSVKSSEPVERMMAIDTRLNLADDLLNYTDKITMHFSLECRVPMLDLEFVKFVQSLPREMKLNLRQGKIVHRKFANDLLPTKIVRRKKKAFQSPTNRWFKQDPDALRDILLAPGSNYAHYFSTDVTAQIIDEHCNGINRERELFLLISIYYWMQAL